MLLAALCLQASLLSHPLFLDEEPPELRSAQHVLLLHDDLAGVGHPLGRDHAATLELAASLHAQLEQGADFADVARRFSGARTAATGGYLGSYARGVLKEPIDAWLFGAELGELSPVFDTPQGVHLVKRVETYAGARVIQLPADAAGRALAARLLDELAQGADFAELAREHSVDPESAARGGAFKVFERGSRDMLVKAAAFQAPLGAVVGPVETPVGLFLVERVEPASLAPELWERNFIRVRAVLVTYRTALGANVDMQRTTGEAKLLADEVYERVRKGEDFAAIAGRFNDDPGGKERAGDLGWLHRYHPDLPSVFQGLFLQPPGTLLEPISTPAGYVIARRER
ncbi:MAG: peptidylprolyl isomerase [Planctomycetes bacterium]|nr:peptidylprolyl isomerase [Planctomycetota bacterium]